MSTCTNLFRSNRTYSERACANPTCEHGKKFIPHDRRQLYCCPRCGDDAGNDKARELRLTKFSPEKQLRNIDEKLRMLYAQYLKDGNCLVQKIIFQHELIDLTLFINQQVNPDTGQKVNWIFEYGTELHHENHDWFYIHKRKIK